MMIMTMEKMVLKTSDTDKREMERYTRYTDTPYIYKRGNTSL